MEDLIFGMRKLFFCLRLVRFVFESTLRANKARRRRFKSRHESLICGLILGLRNSGSIKINRDLFLSPSH